MNPSTLPLPLELAKPMFLAGDLDTLVKATLHVGTYDPHTQIKAGGCYFDTSSESESDSTSSGGGIVTIDLQLDFVQLDDILNDISN
jgi:hypothetical protein